MDALGYSKPKCNGCGDEGVILRPAAELVGSRSEGIPPGACPDPDKSLDAPGLAAKKPTPLRASLTSPAPAPADAVGFSDMLLQLMSSLARLEARGRQLMSRSSPFSPSAGITQNADKYVYV